MLEDRSTWVPIKRGAEASLWRMTLFGRRCVAKYSESKPWRAPALDFKLRYDRLQNEARSNLKCIRAGIPVAPILYIDRPSCTIVMEELTGPTVKQFIFDCTDPSDPAVRTVLRQVGVLVARLHEGEIIHSDLTTSNFMIHGGGVRVIDFGLSFISTMAEDKAVDLYVLERAFQASHPGKEELLEIVMAAYKETLPNVELVLTRLKKVRARGRKRSMAG
jgi:TP53 regulating kinase-like protein